jgi:hypothetical protein
VFEKKVLWETLGSNMLSEWKAVEFLNLKTREIRRDV